MKQVLANPKTFLLTDRFGPNKLIPKTNMTVGLIDVCVCNPTQQRAILLRIWGIRWSPQLD